MEDVPLEAILTRARRRDPAAFERLVELYQRRLHGFFYRLTGSRDDADDLVQELFLRVVRNIDRYSHAGHFEAWLFRIATNLARDRARRARANPLRVAAEGQADPEGRPEAVDGSVTSSPSDGLEQSEEAERLHAALEALPPGEREVILLRHYSDLSFREIAEVLGTPLGTALARGHRGLSRLRSILTECQRHG